MKRVSASDLRGLYAPMSQEGQAKIDGVLSALPKRKEKPMMKKNLTALALAAALVMLTAVSALAATQWEKIASFLNGYAAQMDVNEEAIAAPELLENGSAWLAILPQEAYWTEEGLHLAMRVSAAEENTLAVCSAEIDGGGEEEDLPLDEKHIQIGDEFLTVGDWRQGKTVVSYDVFGGEGWNYYRRGEKGEDYLLTLLSPDTAKLARGGEWAFQVTARNLLTGETELSTLTLRLPPLSMQPGRK